MPHRTSNRRTLPCLLGSKTPLLAFLLLPQLVLVQNSAAHKTEFTIISLLSTSPGIASFRWVQLIPQLQLENCALVWRKWYTDPKGDACGNEAVRSDRDRGTERGPACLGGRITIHQNCLGCSGRSVEGDIGFGARNLDLFTAKSHSLTPKSAIPGVHEVLRQHSKAENWGGWVLCSSRELHCSCLLVCARVDLNNDSLRVSVLDTIHGSLHSLVVSLAALIDHNGSSVCSTQLVGERSYLRR